MTNAKKDGNSASTLICPLNTDGTTVTRVTVSTNGRLGSSNATGGSDQGNRIIRDENQVPVLIGVSSADGVTPITVYATSNGKILINSL